MSDSYTPPRWYSDNQKLFINLLREIRPKDSGPLTNLYWIVPKRYDLEDQPAFIFAIPVVQADVDHVYLGLRALPVDSAAPPTDNLVEAYEALGEELKRKGLL